MILIKSSHLTRCLIVCVDKMHTSDYNFFMKMFEWNNEKNDKLKQERNISFEEVIFAIENDDVLDILPHPNRRKYPDQYLFVVNIDDYVYLIPFVESEEAFFLKTIIPSRKATRQYIKKE
jgi:uncharacterized DUF497 family protein